MNTAWPDPAPAYREASPQFSTTVANFFWIGDALSLYERLCIESFMRQGFQVRVFGYATIGNLPVGAEFRSAEEVLPFTEIPNVQQGGQKSPPAAISNFLRYRLLEREPGWWFDTDLICLASVRQFDNLVKGSPGLVVGEEAPGAVNSAVMHISDPTIARALWARALETVSSSAGTIPWGTIGPRLITDWIGEHLNRALVLPASHFYPIPFNRMEDLFLRDQLVSWKQPISHSFTLHLWNEQIRRFCIPKEFLPPVGSTLHRLFLEIEADLGDYPSLPERTTIALLNAGRAGISERVPTNARQILMFATRHPLWTKTSMVFFRGLSWVRSRLGHRRTAGKGPTS